MFLSKKVSSQKLNEHVKMYFIPELTRLSNEKKTKEFFKKFRELFHDVLGGESQHTWNELGHEITKKLNGDPYAKEKEIMFLDIPSFIYQKEVSNIVHFEEYVNLFSKLTERYISIIPDQDKYNMMERFEKKIPKEDLKKGKKLDPIKKEENKEKNPLSEVEDKIYKKLYELVIEFGSMGYAIEICKGLGYSKRLVDDLTHKLETDPELEKYVDSYPKKHISLSDLKNYSHKNKLKLGAYLDSVKDRNEGKKNLVKVGWSEEFISDL